MYLEEPFKLTGSLDDLRQRFGAPKHPTFTSSCGTLYRCVDRTYANDKDGVLCETIEYTKFSSKEVLEDIELAHDLYKSGMGRIAVYFNKITASSRPEDWDVVWNYKFDTSTVLELYQLAGFDSIGSTFALESCFVLTYQENGGAVSKSVKLYPRDVLLSKFSELRDLTEVCRWLTLEFNMYRAHRAAVKRLSLLGGYTDPSITIRADGAEESAYE